MSWMEWEDRFVLHVATMDDEHRRLIEVMNELYERAKTGDRCAQALALGKLANLMREHFRNEEQHLESIGFPGLERHRGQHIRLLTQFTDHACRFEQGEALGQAFFSFLRFWVVSHICGVDKEYAEYGAALGAARGA